MIQRVSIPNNSANSLKQNKQSGKMFINNKINMAKPYVDSFVKNSKKTAPVMAGLTAVWTAVDHTSKKLPLKKALTNNLKGFFLPVVLGSSVLLAVIENKKTRNNTK